MGISFSGSPGRLSDQENGFHAVTVKSICFGDEDKTPARSISFKGKDSELSIMKSVGSGKMMREGSVRFRTTEDEMFREGPLSEENGSVETNCDTPKSDNGVDKSPRYVVSSDPNHEAAIKLQKVYKSFRTRRKLADCAVLAEQSWWKLLDFAELKHSSISFFDLDKHETAVSRWSRARTRAAKVGKGLSKNCKAQKLALQHWLEAIDPRHRYGHNLHFYYVKWLHSQSKEPFFYWLDIGEGKEVNLVEKCPRSKLLQQCIKYLGPAERKSYEIVFEDGMLLYEQSGDLLNTTGESKNAKWIFVLSTSKVLYIGKKKKGAFQHSSFLAGGATLAAGRIIAERGILKAVWPHSGHYRTTLENFKDFISFLVENNVDITDLKMDTMDEAEYFGKQGSSSHLKMDSPDEDLSEEEHSASADADVEAGPTLERSNSTKEETDLALEPQHPISSTSFGQKLNYLEIPSRDDLVEKLKNESTAFESLLDGYETTEESFASEKTYEADEHELSEAENEQTAGETIPRESILERINLLRGMNLCQLGRQPSCRWSTGAGPRIGCLRDYPSGLQSMALEHVNLSPKSSREIGLAHSAWVSRSPSRSADRLLAHRNGRPCRTQSSPLCMRVGTFVDKTS